MITLIAALDEHDAIGLGNTMPWHLPADMKHFRSLTMGHTVLMGRCTFDSLPKGALPDRRNVVLTAQPDLQCPGCLMVHSMDEALEVCRTVDEAFIIGGRKVSASSSPWPIASASHACITSSPRPTSSSPTSIGVSGARRSAPNTPPTSVTPTRSHSPHTSGGKGLGGAIFSLEMAANYFLDVSGGPKWLKTSFWSFLVTRNGCKPLFGRFG